jgi:predicted esterase
LIIIGDRDDRVGTDQAIALSRTITASALSQGLNAKVELHVLPEPKGHTTPNGAAEQAAEWIQRQIGISPVSA